MFIPFSLFFISAFLLSVVFTFVVRFLAQHLNILDAPNEGRKRHKKATPLLGGVAIFLSFFLVLFLARNQALSGGLEARHWLGFFIGSCFLMIGGFLDDKYKLPPSRQLVWPILAVISVIAGGVEITKITNPLGGYFIPGVLSFGLIFFWLLAMMYTTKLLDGVDGLVSGVTAIGGLVIFLFTMTTRYYQPDIGVASFIFAGACLGFLIFNWHPAKIFLGEGGSLFLGFALGVLAIISGGKIAVALLVMGLPVLDLFWTIIRRIWDGKNPFRFADRKHLHFRLLDIGLGQRLTVVFYYLFSAVFGLSALFLQSAGKIFALILLVIIMAGFVLFLNDSKPKK